MIFGFVLHVSFKFVRFWLCVRAAKLLVALVTFLFFVNLKFRSGRSAARS